MNIKSEKQITSLTLEFQNAEEIGIIQKIMDEYINATYDKATSDEDLDTPSYRYAKNVLKHINPTVNLDVNYESVNLDVEHKEDAINLTKPIEIQLTEKQQRIERVRKHAFNELNRVYYLTFNCRAEGLKFDDDFSNIRFTFDEAKGLINVEMWDDITENKRTHKRIDKSSPLPQDSTVLDLDTARELIYDLEDFYGIADKLTDEQLGYLIAFADYHRNSYLSL